MPAPSEHKISKWAAIIDVANRRRADLIVLGRTRFRTVGLGVQSHILQVDHEAPSPVLCVL